MRLIATQSLKDAHRNNLKNSVNVDLNTNIRQLNKSVSSSNEGQASSLTAKEIVWLTSKEAANFLKISEATLRNMTSNGKIPYSKLGSSNRYSLNELNRLLLSTQRGIPYGY